MVAWLKQPESAAGAAEKTKESEGADAARNRESTVNASGSRKALVADAAGNRWRGWWNKWEPRKQPDQ